MEGVTMSETLLSVKNLKKYYPVYGGVLYRKVAEVHAVDEVSFDLKAGETLGIVGESGCGKSTLGKTLLRLYEPTSGDILFEGKKINELPKLELRSLRREMQMIFQDPAESLNSRHTVGHILEEPFIIQKIGTEEERKERVMGLLKRVGLNEAAYYRYPHEFSGGQRQRIGIARAVALRPKLIVCDEPVSALDVSVQSQILNLLLELQKEMNLTLIFIAHDLSVVKHISDRVAVMYLGKIVELANSEEIYKRPRHPYTEALISAIPHPDPKLRHEIKILEGDIPSPMNPPSGCRFHTRCPYAKDDCKKDIPELNELSADHFTACKYPVN